MILVTIKGTIYLNDVGDTGPLDHTTEVRRTRTRYERCREYVAYFFFFSLVAETGDWFINICFSFRVRNSPASRSCLRYCCIRSGMNERLVEWHREIESEPGTQCCCACVMHARSLFHEFSYEILRRFLAHASNRLPNDIFSSPEYDAQKAQTYGALGIYLWNRRYLRHVTSL